MFVSRDGARYLMRALTRGRGVPYMPREVRQLIWNALHPLPWLSCDACGCCLILVDVAETLVTKNVDYVLSGDTARCYVCKKSGSS